MSEAIISDNGQTEQKIASRQELRSCALLQRQSAAAFAVRRWWQLLSLTPQQAKEKGLEQSPWSPGLRARLRRCETPEAAVLTEGFRRLWQVQQKAAGDKAGRLDIAAWACVAMVLAEVKDDRPDVSFAAMAGHEKGDSGERVVSGLRFQQLQAARSEDELVRRLRRILAILRGEPISVVLLADDILLWFAERQHRQIMQKPTQRLAFRWAQSYFDQVARYKSAEV